MDIILNLIGVINQYVLLDQRSSKGAFLNVSLSSLYKQVHLHPSIPYSVTVLPPSKWHYCYYLTSLARWHHCTIINAYPDCTAVLFHLHIQMEALYYHTRLSRWHYWIISPSNPDGTTDLSYWPLGPAVTEWRGLPCWPYCTHYPGGPLPCVSM